MLLRLRSFWFKKKKKILNLDSVKRLEEECGHINVGIVSIVHLHTDAHTHTHIQNIYCEKAHVRTHIAYFMNCV